MISIKVSYKTTKKVNIALQFKLFYIYIFIMFIVHLYDHHPRISITDAHHYAVDNKCIYSTDDSFVPGIGFISHFRILFC